MDKILILDFGSQYTQLIARRIRELNVYSEIHPFDVDPDFIANFGANGIILSGGPLSIFDDNAPQIPNIVIDLNVWHDIPIFGICYGMQALCHKLGGKVETSNNREYGDTTVGVLLRSDLLRKRKGNRYINSAFQVWMSHGDKVTDLPPDFQCVATSPNCQNAAIENTARRIFGLQFHPEVSHTTCGVEIIANFIDLCACKPTWTMSNFKDSAISSLQDTIGNNKVVCGLSGGVDSSVTAMLLHEAIGSNLTCIFVDNGLLRMGEAQEVTKMFRDTFNLNLKHIDAAELFLNRLKGVDNPEQKRKIIGGAFVEVFEKEAAGAKYLAQGTLYPDVIESVSLKGPSATIKTHHNVGGLPEKMNLQIIEPLRELFKDEVRNLGLELQLPDQFINRHPFPGPGLAVRILGEVTAAKLDILRQIDKIFIDELIELDYYHQIWQAFAVLLPVKSVGVMGDARTYDNVCALRAVTSLDGMTADVFDLPMSVLKKISNRIVNEVDGINRVTYDTTSKPPGTIEWE